MYLAILNSFIILASCDSTLSHPQFKLTLVRDLIQEAERVPQPQTASQKRQAPSTNQIQRLKTQQTLAHVVKGNLVPCAFHQNQRNKYKIQVSRMQHKVVWGGCGFSRRGFMKKQRLVRRSFMCVCICFTSPIWGKNKSHCLEMSVNNLWLLEKSWGYK
jgi:hypothetical protein